MLDFRTIMNGTVPGGIWSLLLPLFIVLAILTYIYAANDLMTRKKYLRNVLVAIFGSLFLYSLALMKFPPIRLIPNVVITPILDSTRTAEDRALPFFVSQLLHRSFPEKLHVVDYESVHLVLNSRQVSTKDSLLKTIQHDDVHFSVTSEFISDHVVQLNLYDMRYDRMDLMAEWKIETNIDKQTLITIISNSILEQLYPDLIIKKNRLTETITQLLPTNPKTLINYLQAQKLVTGGDFKQAIPALEKWSKEDTSFAWFDYYIGKSWYEEARITFTDSLEKKKYINRSIRSLLTAIRKDQTNAEFLNQLADVYIYQLNFDDAEIAAKAAYQMDPYHYKAYLNLGRMQKFRWANFEFMENQQFTAQSQLIRKSLDLNPFSYEAIFFLTVITEEKRGQQDMFRQGMMNQLEKSIQLNPNFAAGITEAWRVSILRRDFSKSKYYADRLTTIQPKNPNISFYKGMEFYHQGKLDSSITWFSRNLTYGPNPNASMFLGAVYEEKGDTTKAVKYYTERILQRESDKDPIAASAYKRLRALDVRAWREVNRTIPPFMVEE